MRANLYIGAITGYTAQERAEAISEELLRINIPFIEQGAASKRAFRVVVHPTTEEAVLKVDTTYQIWVHPDNSLDTLISLMPDLPQAVKNGLVALIQSSQSIVFGQLLTGTETTLTEAQMLADGWFNY